MENLPFTALKMLHRISRNLQAKFEKLVHIFEEFVKGAPVIRFKYWWNFRIIGFTGLVIPFLKTSAEPLLFAIANYPT